MSITTGDVTASIRAWAEVSDLRPDLQSRPDALEAIEAASQILWNLAGQLYTPVSVITEAYDTRTTLSKGSEVYPIMRGGAFYNVSDCSACVCAGCGIMHRTRLRGKPVQYIVDVWVDGQLIPRTDYVLLDSGVLGFKTGVACSANCIVVKYAWGTGVPSGGKAAVVKLAEQLLLARGGSTDCELPQRVTSISRQGVSYTLLDPQDFLNQGRTGIYEIDLLLRAINPAGALRPARVFSVDLPRAEVSTVVDPPLSVVLNPEDVVVLPGLDGRWSSNDPGLLSAYSHGHQLVTALSDGTVISDTWHPVVPGATGLVLDLLPAETAAFYDGMRYTVFDGSHQILTGLVRSF